ncbi:class II histocompatibility antigen, B-L beta chain-like [Ambystoma mexicanum]|uniref:class II histocompatibility antigen, B-L beta chain-like n=1 Tax=Ambystoma mexicanum TaxID=8296 RepID=UPI0037E7483F
MPPLAWITILLALSCPFTAGSQIFQQLIECSKSPSSPATPQCWWRAAYNREQLWDFNLLNSNIDLLLLDLNRRFGLPLEYLLRELQYPLQNTPFAANVFMSLTAKEIVAPHVTINAEETEVGAPLYTLCCRATGFYPPNINVTWFLDGSPLAHDHGMKELVILPNSNGTFQTTSYMPFSISHTQAKNYLCAVQHISTPEGLNATWEAPGLEEHKAELAIGILAGLAGIFFASSALVWHGCCKKGRITSCWKHEGLMVEISEMAAASEAASPSV